MRNDDWWGGKPYLDSVELIFSDDLATQISGIQGGAVDSLVQFSVVGGEAIFADSSLTVESIRASAHRQIWMNTREGTFVDKGVRQAIALGLDRQALVDNVLQGKGDMANDHPIAPIYSFFDSSQPQRARDIEKAKQLLADAGKEGLKITMNAPKLQEIPQLAELVQTQLKEIGMDITLNVESTSTFYDQWCKVYDSTNEPAGCDGGAGVRHRRLRPPSVTGRLSRQGLRDRRVELSALRVGAVQRGLHGVPDLARHLGPRRRHQEDAGHRQRRRALRDPVLLQLA